MKFKVTLSPVVKQPTVIVVDYSYYARLQKEIDHWCEETFNYQPRQGMVLTFQNESDMTCFLLRWE